MATYTGKLNLEKPLQTEKYNVDVFNANVEKIDKAFADLDQDDNVKTSGDQIIDGVKTFKQAPKSQSDPTDDTDLVNKHFVGQSIENSEAGISEQITEAQNTMQNNYDQLNSAMQSLDESVVKLSGTQVIGGVKTFSSPPSVPKPVSNNDATNKVYVDDAIANSGHISSQQVSSRDEAKALSAQNPNILYYWDEPAGSANNVTADTPIKIVVSPTKPAEIDGVTILWIEGEV